MTGMGAAVKPVGMDEERIGVPQDSLEEVLNAAPEVQSQELVYRSPLEKSEVRQLMQLMRSMEWGALMSKVSSCWQTQHLLITNIYLP
jgi:hypothetical protein